MDLDSEAFRNRKMTPLKFRVAKGEVGKQTATTDGDLDTSDRVGLQIKNSFCGQSFAVLYSCDILHWLRIRYIHSALVFPRNWMPAVGFPTNSIRDTPAFNADRMNCIHIKFDFTWYHFCQPTFMKTNSQWRQASNEGASNFILRQALTHLPTTKSWVQSLAKNVGIPIQKGALRLLLHNFYVPLRNVT